jgi:hypothetical protein
VSVNPNIDAEGQALRMFKCYSSGGVLAFRTVDQSNSGSLTGSRIFVSRGTREFGEQGIIDLIGING